MRATISKLRLNDIFVIYLSVISFRMEILIIYKFNHVINY